MYYKPMGDLLAAALNRDGLIIHQALIMRITSFLYMYLYKNFELKRGGGLIIHHGLVIHTIILYSRIFTFGEIVNAHNLGTQGVCLWA